MNSDYSLKELIQILAEERGLDLRGYKHASLERRIRKRLLEVGVPNYRGYLEKVRQDPRELNELLNTILINVTEFFRDPQAWDALRTEALPRLLRNLRPGDTFRAWSAGCATGEEPYSLAILLTDHFGPQLPEYDIKIFATDIDDDALNTARRGEYTFRGADAWPALLPAGRDGTGKRQRTAGKVKVKVKLVTARSRKATAGAKKKKK